MAVPPFPGQKLVEAVLRDFGDAGENVGEPSLGIDTVELSGADKAVHDCCTLGAAV